MAVNKARINKVIAALKKAPRYHFNMEGYLQEAYNLDENPCGTAGCIAGWAAMLATNSNPKSKADKVLNTVEEVASDNDLPRWDYTAAHSVAQKWLGLTTKTAQELFAPNIPLALVTKNDAIAALEVVKKKGTITRADWKRIMS